MRLLVDSQLPVALARHIDASGTSCVHARDIGLARASDQTIWNYAKLNNLVIVSKDQDFRQMAITRGTPPQVIWVRVGNCRRADMIAAFDLRWKGVLAKLRAGTAVTELR